jgi:hypothetical protein
MPISVKCACGRALKVPEAMAGKKGRCPACNGVVAVPAAEIDEALPAEPVAPRRPDSFRPRQDRDDYDDRPSRRRVEDDDDRRPARRRDEEEDYRPARRRDEDDRYSDRRRDEEDEPRRSRPRLAREDDRPRRRRNEVAKGGGGSWGMNPSVGGGLLAMIGAIVWFFGGLAFGIIFFYPPILFVIGLVAFIGGLVKGE